MSLKEMQEAFYSPRTRLRTKTPVRIDLLLFCKQTTWSYIYGKTPGLLIRNNYDVAE